MQKTGIEQSDVEIIDTYYEILDLIVRTYNNPLRVDFIRQSRSAQLGYDLMRLAMDKGVIAPGGQDPQIKMDTDRKEAADETISQSDKG